ncbi:MAG: hypothetical protein IT289_01535 [Oligoflexia bacterium]|nr:hypothetical protein [Oligoflexia bacterium]
MSRRVIFEYCSNCGAKIVDDSSALLVDDHNDLIYCGDACAREYFEDTIQNLRKLYLSARSGGDVPISEFSKYEKYLTLALTEPDEVWDQSEESGDHPLCAFIGEFLDEERRLYYLALAYVSDGQPSFVYFHFPTFDEKLVEQFRHGRLIFDGNEGEEEPILNDLEMNEENVAFGLYQEMLGNRITEDIDPEDFQDYAELKIKTLENPEEIWQVTDSDGITFQVFIASFFDGAEKVFYILVCVEDEANEAIIPVFGFPTVDIKMVERFRKGEKVERASVGNS